MAWLPCRVSCRTIEVFGIGRGIWLGSTFDGLVWPIEGVIEATAWFGRGGGIPYILGGCIEPGIAEGGAPCKWVNSEYALHMKVEIQYKHTENDLLYPTCDPHNYRISIGKKKKKTLHWKCAMYFRGPFELNIIFMQDHWDTKVVVASIEKDSYRFSDGPAKLQRWCNILW